MTNRPEQKIIIISSAVVILILFGFAYFSFNQQKTINQLNEKIMKMEDTLTKNDSIGKENDSVLDSEPENEIEKEEPKLQEQIDTHQDIIDTETNNTPANQDINPLEETNVQQLAPKTDISSIGYSLPDGWRSEIQENTLMLYAPEGGYIGINVYDFPSNTGRRAYYCQIAGTCIDSTTFTPTQIGNISGYEATGLDNSGGGREYFGAVGGSFIRITTFSPSSPTNNPFDQGRDLVLQSLTF